MTEKGAIIAAACLNAAAVTMAANQNISTPNDPPAVATLAKLILTECGKIGLVDLMDIKLGP